MVPHGTIDVLGMICVEEQIMKYLQGYCSQKKSVNFLDKYFSEHMRHGSNLIFIDFNFVHLSSTLGHLHSGCNFHWT